MLKTVLPHRQKVLKGTIRFKSTSITQLMN